MDSMEAVPITYGTVWVTPNIPVCLFQTERVDYTKENLKRWYTGKSVSLFVRMDIRYLAGNLEKFKQSGYFPKYLQSRFDFRKIVIYGAQSDISNVHGVIYGWLGDSASRLAEI